MHSTLNMYTVCSILYMYIVHIHVHVHTYIEQSSIEVKDHDFAVRINHTNLTTLSWTIDTLLEENVTARAD